MNEGLFSKYSKVLQEKKSEKKEVLQLLFSISGIIFNEEEITVHKKNISFNTSSVKKSFIVQKNIKSKIEAMGYTIT